MYGGNDLDEGRRTSARATRTLDRDAESTTASERPADRVAAPRPRNNFDGLRLLAALLVVYGHQTIDQTGTAGLRLVMFFSISGFLVTGSWARDPHVGRFLARRFLRIWPAYAALVVASAALTGLFPARDLPDISRLASAFYLGNLWFEGFDWGFFPFHSPMLNQSLWMMPFEVDSTWRSRYSLSSAAARGSSSRPRCCCSPRARNRR